MKLISHQGAGFITAAMFSCMTLATPLGLPPMPVPDDNPQSAKKIELGDKLFHDTRFSSTGDVSCSTCHDLAKALTDSPLEVSEGIEKLTGTRNAPTVLNAGYNKTQFWDGRSPSLEDQARHPFINPVEMGLTDHQPIMAVISGDGEYQKAFKDVFGINGSELTIDHVLKAIASFEREQLSGNSRFDRFWFESNKSALNESQQRGLLVFLGQGRCVSCHVIEQDHALFTDHKFHNIGVGVNDLGEEIVPLAQAFIKAKADGIDVDIEVLTNANSSHLGRFAITGEMSDLGAFKTPTLRSISETAPYMHDGSFETLKDVVIHYNNGGARDDKEKERINPFLSGGIRPLALSEQQMDDLVAYLESLTPTAM